MFPALKSFCLLGIALLAQGYGASKESYMRRRLEVTDETLMDLMDRVQVLETGRNQFCAVPGWCVVFDFESGINGWTTTGTAFNNQPTYGDNPTARKRKQPSKNKGDWWIGTFENCPNSYSKRGLIQGDGPQGTLTSPPFAIKGTNFRFLFGGGCKDTKNLERVELLIDGKVVAKKTANFCTESMVTEKLDVDSSYKGKIARVRLVDEGSSGWQHINFDHFEMLVSN